jgi:hypothetical protein
MPSAGFGAFRWLRRRCDRAERLVAAAARCGGSSACRSNTADHHSMPLDTIPLVGAEAWAQEGSPLSSSYPSFVSPASRLVFRIALYVVDDKRVDRTNSADESPTAQRSRLRVGG